VTKIGFIGAGNMAAAIISGITRLGLEASLLACDLCREKTEALHNQYGVIPEDSIASLVEDAQYVFLAVKPQNFPEVLRELRSCFKPDTVLISIAAGITSSSIQRALTEGMAEPFQVKVVRAMPNTPLLISCGATALSRTASVTEDEFVYVQMIFECAGVTAVIPEEKMNEIIPINGSSPAFIYLLAQYFIDYGESQGIDGNICRMLFAKTLEGSAKMLLDLERSTGELIKMVSSPGGTTIAGLKALQENGLEAAVKAACKSCIDRAYELTE